jgi:hypothetical protein
MEFYKKWGNWLKQFPPLSQEGFERCFEQAGGIHLRSNRAFSEVLYKSYIGTLAEEQACKDWKLRWSDLETRDWDLEGWDKKWEVKVRDIATLSNGGIMVNWDPFESGYKRSVVEWDWLLIYSYEILENTIDIKYWGKVPKDIYLKESYNQGNKVLIDPIHINFNKDLLL